MLLRQGNRAQGVKRPISHPPKTGLKLLNPSMLSSNLNIHFLFDRAKIHSCWQNFTRI